jgi:hypothetical protein
MEERNLSDPMKQIEARKAEESKREIESKWKERCEVSEIA